MKKRLMIVAFLVLALIFTAGCGSEKNEEAELETKSAGYHIMNRRSSNMTREDGFCETFTNYINGKTFEKGDRLSLKEAFGEYQTLLVDRVVIERIVVLDMRHADHGIMPVERAAVQADRVVARRDGHVLAVGKFVVQIAAEIKIAVAVCRCGTHDAKPPSFVRCPVYPPRRGEC